MFKNFPRPFTTPHWLCVKPYYKPTASGSGHAVGPKMKWAIGCPLSSISALRLDLVGPEKLPGAYRVDRD